MKKLCLFLAVIVLSTFSLCFFGCADKPVEPEKPSIYVDKTEVTVYKGESIDVNVVSETKIDTMNLRWTFSSPKIVSVTQDKMKMTINGVLFGETDVIFTLSGKEIGRVKVTVKDHSLTLMLPNDRLVLSQRQQVTVRAFYDGDTTAVPVWNVGTDKIKIENQDLIAKISVSSDCPDGEYEASLTVGEQTRKFLIIVGV